MQIQENSTTSQEESIFEDTALNREEYPLLFTLKYILDFYFGEISLNTIISFSAKSNKGLSLILSSLKTS